MKYLIMMILLFLSISNFCLADLQATLYSPDIQRIVSRGQIRVAMYQGELPPFIYHDSSGKLTGFDITLSQNIAQQLGVKLVIDQNAHTFDDVVNQVASGKDDIAISNLTATPKRALSVNFTESYYRMPQVLLMMPDFSQKNKNLLFLNKTVVSKLPCKIGVLQQSSYISYAKLTFPNAIIVPYSTLSDGLTLLKEGKINLIMTDGLSAKKMIVTDRDMKEIVITSMPGHHDPISIAVNSNSPNLLNWFNIYLNNIDTQVAIKQWEKTFSLPEENS